MAQIALRDQTPERQPITSYGALLEELMWVYRIECGLGQRFIITGTIKPDMTADTPEEWRRSMLGRYETILRIIEEAGGVFAQLPELTLTGNVKFRIETGNKPHWDRMEAQIRIELHSH